MPKAKPNPLKPYDGKKEILDEHRKNPVPERELWSAVILQAMTNIYFKVPNWEEDLSFLSGAGNWNWICELLGTDPKRASKLALKAACGNLKVIHKH